MMMTDPVLEVLKPGAAAVNAAEVINPESDAVFATDAGKADLAKPEGYKTEKPGGLEQPAT